MKARYICTNNMHRPSTTVPDRPLHTSVQRLSIAATSIRYSAFFGGSAMPAQHTPSTAFCVASTVALELSTRQLERSGSRKTFQCLLMMHLFTLYWIIQRIRDVSGRYALQIGLLPYFWTLQKLRECRNQQEQCQLNLWKVRRITENVFIPCDLLPFSSRTVAYWLFARGHDARLQRPVKLNSFRQNFWVFVLQHMYEHQTSAYEA